MTPLILAAILAVFWAITLWLASHSTSSGAFVLREPAAIARRSEVTDEQIKHMANRFLGWRLPETFSPDGGISFEPVGNEGSQYEYRRQPVGTNLLCAAEAEAMVRHIVEGLPDA